MISWERENMHNPILTKNWGCPKKQKAREDTVIVPYRNRYGWSVPKGFQYWTLCGLCAKDGKLAQGCELDHVTKEGLITSDQFYGVEIQSSIHEQNKVIKGPHWFHNRINQEIINHKTAKDFKPAIVNFDMISYPNNCANEFGSMMLILSRLKHPVMLIGNFVLKAWVHERKDSDFIIEQLNKTPQVSAALEIADWEYDRKCYEYYGADKKSKSILGTIVLHKKGETK